jgi:serine/threonine-protein kinase
MRDTAPEQILDEIVAGYLDAVARGEQPDRSQLLACHPDLAGPLADFFADHDQIQQVARPLRPLTGADNSSAAFTLSPVCLGNPGECFGPYELLGEIARGGMGIVYKARHKTLGRVVALKTILAGRQASPAEVARFELEAAVVANLDHPHIVPVYDSGIHEGHYFLCMKWIEGANLAQEMAGRRGQLATRAHQLWAAGLIADVARAIHHAHQHGVLHRDLKPANILVDAQGRAHVTDFGLAKRVPLRTDPPDTPAEEDLTQTGQAVGTPSYMAPEQARGRSGCLTTAADVYSLGAILYFLLTGQPPFRSDTPLGTLLDALEHDAVRPGSLVRGINRDLETICLKCLSKDVARRYGSSAELPTTWSASVPACPSRPGRSGRRSGWGAGCGASRCWRR